MVPPQRLLRFLFAPDDIMRIVPSFMTIRFNHKDAALSTGLAKSQCHPNVFCKAYPQSVHRKSLILRKKKDVEIPRLEPRGTGNTPKKSVTRVIWIALR